MKHSGLRVKRVIKPFTVAVIILIMLTSNYPNVTAQQSPAILANSTRDARYVERESEAVPFDAVLTGAYVWDFWMENLGGTPITAPRLSLLTQYERERFPYVEPEPVVSPSGPPYQYGWGFADIPIGEWDAEAYMQSDIPVTYSLGFDSERIVSPAEISTNSEAQIVLVRVTPREGFQRIAVTITADETDETSGEFLWASPMPTQEEMDQGYYFESGDNYAHWNYPQVQVGVTYEFTVQFMMNNKIYPAVVLHKPRVRVHGQYLTENLWDFSTGESITRSDPFLGDMTFAASLDYGAYTWSHIARERKVVVYGQKAEIAPGQGSVNAQYVGVRRERVPDLTLQPSESRTFTPPPQDGWSIDRTRLSLYDITSPTTGQLVQSFDEAYALIQVEGGHPSDFGFEASTNWVAFTSDPDTTTVTIRNKSTLPLTIPGVSATYRYRSRTGIRPVAVLNLGGDMRRIDVTVPHGFVTRYAGFFNYRFLLRVDWWDTGRTIPVAIYNPDPDTGNPSSRDLLALYGNEERADWGLFSWWDTGIDIALSANIRWSYLKDDGTWIVESWLGFYESGETVEGTWSILMKVEDPAVLQDYSIPSSRMEGSLRLEKRVLWNEPITLDPGVPYVLTAPQIAGWYRDETDYLYIIPDPEHATWVSTESVIVTPALRRGHWWWEHSADWHPLGNTVILQLDPSVTEQVTFLFTYTVGYYTNLPTAGITVTDIETNDGDYVRHDLAITLPEYSTYAALGFDPSPVGTGLSLWTPGINWLLDNLYTPQGLSADDPSLRNDNYQLLPDFTLGQGMGFEYSHSYGFGSSIWNQAIYNVMQASGYTAAGIWRWIVREPITEVSTDAAVYFEGTHRDTFTDTTLGPGQPWTYSAPAPPAEGWLFDRSWFMLSGLSISQADLLSGNMLRVTGAHLVCFKFDIPDNYAYYYGDPSSSSITIENISTGTVTIVSIDIFSIYLDVKDVHSVEVYDIGPDFRQIFVDVPFGFVADQGGFFNQWLRFRLRWEGKAIPFHVYSPGPVGRYVDVLQVYRTQEGADPRFMTFTDTQSRIFISRPKWTGLYELGLPVEGTWRFDLQVLDPTQYSMFGPELRAFTFNQKTIHQTFELAAAGSQGDSIIITPPTISGWRRAYADELVVISNTEGIPPESVTVSAGASVSPNADVTAQWRTYGDILTLRNTATQPASFTIGYNVYYFAPLSFTDTRTSQDSTVTHEISFSLPPYAQYAALGFDDPATDTRIMINTPLTDPPWQFSSFTTPSGQSADDQTFNNPSYEYTMGYIEGETLSTLYGVRQAAAFFIYAVLGSNAEGTWHITAYEPATVMRFTLGSPADLLVTDPLGRQVGFNGFAQINQIPGASYTGPASEPEVITIPTPLLGRYKVQVTGTGSGTYTLTTETSVAGATISQQTVFGTITKGTVVTGSVPVQNPEGMPQIELELNPYTISFMPPISLPDFDPHPGQSIPIKFTVNSASTGEFAFDDTVVVKIYAPDETMLQAFVYGSGNDAVRIDTTVPQYILNLHTAKSTPTGTYTVIVSFANGSFASISFTLTTKK